MQLRTLLALAGLTIAATACGGDKNSMGPDGDGPGASAYSATITGDVSRSLSGQAAFAVDNEDEDVGFGMAMARENATDGIFVMRRSPGVLAVGQHTVADQSAVEDESEIPANHLAVDVFLNEAGLSLFCVSTGGTLTVTSSSASRLKGSFQVTAACQDLLGEELSEITVTGTFDAVGSAFVPTH
jgi:hypothetical protein